MSEHFSKDKECRKCKTKFTWSTECINCDWSELQLICPQCDYSEVY